VLLDCETGCVLECNPEFERQAGRTLDELKALKIWELRPRKNKRQPGRRFSKSGDRSGSSVLELQRPDGSSMPVDFVSKVIRIQGMCFIQSVSRDITERCTPTCAA